MENFSDVAKSAWTTDDGKTTFCVPMASVIHGFIYNKEIFEELELTPPKTEDEFHRRPRQDQGRRQIRAARHGHRRPVGSRHHGLPEHRPELLEGRGRPQGADRRHGRSSPTSPMSTPSRSSPSGRPTWATATRRRTIPTARTSSPSARPPSIRPARGTSRPSRSRPTSSSAPSRRRSPKAGDNCYISDHTDIGIGMNAKSTNAEDGQDFLDWVASPEFADIYANALPGFFPLSNAKVTIKDPVAAEVRRAGAATASRRSATPTRSCRAARPTSRTSCGTSAPRCSTAP